MNVVTLYTCYIFSNNVIDVLLTANNWVPAGTNILFSFITMAVTIYYNAL